MNRDKSGCLPEKPLSARAGIQHGRSGHTFGLHQVHGFKRIHDQQYRHSQDNKQNDGQSYTIKPVHSPDPLANI